MTPLPPDAVPPADGSPDAAPQGIAFTLEGVDELTFARILRDVLGDAAFARPLQVQAQEPRPGRPARLTLVFWPQDRTRAVQAMQRLKTLLLRQGVQIDTVRVPGES
ncbi:hypothetical protein E5F05_07310 [Deinococcus metallilatus]|uniref:Uncharacterized protein n=1 Tax=Deinococcus metallilatus TaxID=1211322 RepID=A0AAJ5JXI3_9DEIO|nr:hypothetical protein [Deinococcus metallilatus]MBB5297085.1 hypothetical protein [Deinococcus metallilatus]QBY07777.1 hypothetical protein E5F05_07310 [Deinococcus metallilatus]RXJ13477.1 hypothetical protein ERJ73_06145 [Deinococcus metallilatus]TLK22366.1 hypothetical protein FCS05_17855 [Deinococcus metallilatus]